MDLERGLSQEKQPPGNQYDVAPRDLMAHDCEQRRGEAHEPGQRKQKPDACQHRQCQSYESGFGPLMAWQFAGHDRYEDDIVDPEDDLERGEIPTIREDLDTDFSGLQVQIGLRAYIF